MSRAKKATTISVSKKSTACTKKVAAKKAAPKKRVVKTKKTTAKKSTTKSKKTVATIKVGSKDKSKVSKSTETVTLPSAASPRLREKAYVARLLTDFHTPMYRIAYVSAVCFVLIGLTTIVSEYLTIPAQKAEVCSAVNCPGIPDDQNSTGTATVVADPVFDLLDQIPAVIADELKVNFKVRDGAGVTVELLSLDSGDLLVLEPIQISNENYRLVIPGDELMAGQYVIKIIVNAITGSGAFSFAAGGFAVPEPLPENVETETIETEEDVDADNGNDEIIPEDTEQTEAEEIEEVEEAVENGVTPEEEAENSDTEIDSSSDSGESTDENQAETESNDNDDNAGESELDSLVPTPMPLENDNADDLVVEEETFSVLITDRVFTGREVIAATTPVDYGELEIYLRPELAVEARFLGLMTNEFDRWVYAFNSNNLPNGLYELFITARFDDEIVTSDSVMITVLNQVVIETLNAPETESVINDEIPLNRNFYTYESSDDDVIIIDEGDEAESEAQSLVNDNKDTLNDLLQRYAVARQTDDPMLIDALEDEFSSTREELITNSVLDPDTREIASKIDVELTAQIEELKERVDTFEAIRQSRDRDPEVTGDSDGDGISDYDERNVYGTDPNNADTDQDGFIDGAEIISGFNPVDPKAETLVEYELPKEVIGLQRTDVLQVRNVAPLVVKNDVSETERVVATISGTGLPNSYVTIYVFSSPIIVTVKTDADGSFVYEFDKELEDGEHEVYVAFTDNTGSILAHSEPFQFVKEAQAFTPVDASSGTVTVTAPSVVESSTVNAIRLVLAMSILVLGFILLMLGINLRSSERMLQTQQST